MSVKPGPAGQNVQNRGSARQRNLALLSGRLDRTTFTTSRELDYFSEKELVSQTGHDMSDWPLVVVKELIDNAIDACEDAEIAPELDIVADARGITVRDNGPGLPEATLRAALDFTVRVSNREAYVAPDRGAQGNALKTLLAMPYVVDPEHGRFIVQASGRRHIIRCAADPISQRAVIHDDRTEVATTGTKIRIEWSPRSEDDDGAILWPFSDWPPCEGCGRWELSFAQRFRAIIDAFALFNPHTQIHLDWFGDNTTWAPTDTAWEKWKPNRPTSPHWYEQSHFERLIAAYVTHDRDAGTDRLVSAFVAEFDGLTSSQKRSKVLDETELHRIKLSELAGDGQLDGPRIVKLLESMKHHTRPIKSARLGIIGEDHLRARLLSMGVLPESFRYTRKLGTDGLPCVLESAFGWKGEDADNIRQIYAGANWSAAIGNPFRRFGETGEGLESVLTELKVGAHEPVVYVLHLADPRIQYTDRGKTALVISGGDGE